MKYKSLGRSQIKVSDIIMGTWQAGITGFKGKSQWLGIQEQEIAGALLKAVDCGVNTFDTAFIYGEGHSEKVIAKTLEPFRDKVILASKTHPLQLAYDQVINSCHLSLKNLKTDYLDLYQIHFPSGMLGSKKVPLEESMRALNTLKKEGKIRAIGLSNFDQTQIEEAMEFSQIDSLQAPYSLIWRHAEKELIPFCEKHQISFLAYSPLAQSLLTGRVKDPSQIKEGDNRKANMLFKGDHFKRVQEVLAKMQEMVQDKNIQLSQLALAYLIHQKKVSAITGLRNKEQLICNAGASEITITKAEVEKLKQISEIVTDHLDEDPMMWRQG